MGNYGGTNIFVQAVYIYIVCYELIKETVRNRKLTFGMWEYFGYGSTKF